MLRGALDMCLLALLESEPVHGYELVRRVEAAGFDGVGYGAVYPLLTRMRRLGLDGIGPARLLGEDVPGFARRLADEAGVHRAPPELGRLLGRGCRGRCGGCGALPPPGAGAHPGHCHRPRAPVALREDGHRLITAV